VQTVLIVEDDADLRRMYRMALALVGYEILEAGDGLDALRILDAANPPTAVVLDLGLPIMSGAAVRQEISAHAHTRNVPVIVVTGQPGAHEALDVACLLRKPVTPDKLVSVVRSCIAAVQGGSALA
jgi:DNA-binding response OmpR family regulator